MSNQERKGTLYAIATIGARTERSGYITSATSGLTICNLRAALVGDIVTYRDGSQAVITDDSGSLSFHRDKCFALVGSSLSNGDKIKSTPWEDGKSGLFVPEGESPKGLFDPSCVPPPCEAGMRFALRGSTTRRGSRFDSNAAPGGSTAKGLMQMTKGAVQQVYKYRAQKELGHMPSDAQTHQLFAEAAAVHASSQLNDDATNIGLGTEYMQYWIDKTHSVDGAYKLYRGLSNGIYYQKIKGCADKLRADPDSMQPLRDMVK